MKLSRKADYALRSVRCCANLPKGGYGSIRFISESEAIPREFLAKILNDLTAGGILISRRGVTGGYALKRDPKEITFLQVIELINGPLHVSLCTEAGGHGRVGGRDCPMCGFWRSQEKAVRKALAGQHFGKHKYRNAHK